VFKVLGTYLLPVYLALFLWSLYAPGRSLAVVVHLSWVLLIVLGVAWSVARLGPTPEERMAPKVLDCPRCGVSNPAERVLCRACLADLYTLDDQGDVVPIVPEARSTLP